MHEGVKQALTIIRSIVRPLVEVSNFREESATDSERELAETTVNPLYYIIESTVATKTNFADALAQHQRITTTTPHFQDFWGPWPCC